MSADVSAVEPEEPGGAALATVDVANGLMSVIRQRKTSARRHFRGVVQAGLQYLAIMLHLLRLRRL